jgi:helix-turn-helix protein
MSVSEPSDQLLDEIGLADFFHRDVSTIRRWLHAGKLPVCFRQGRRRYWRREALIEFIKARETPSGETAPPRKRRTKRGEAR